MIDSSSMLALLKWVAIGLALASALWALLGRKPTVEDEHGRKQLTAAGFVTAALILGGASISAMSFGFETLAKQKERSDAAQKDREKRREAQEDRRTRDAQNRLLRADARALRAENRAADAEQRVARIALAAEERQRDLLLARDVSLGAQRNLTRTSLALNELERLALPLEPLAFESTWELAADAPGMARWAVRAAAAARRFDDPAFNAKEKALVAFAKEVIEDVKASEEALAEAQKHFDSKEIVEIILTCGFYMTMARLTETTRTDIDPPAGGKVIESLNR